MTQVITDPTMRQLDEYARLVDTAVRRTLAEQAPARETAGDFADAVADYPTRPGKRLRPALLLATCEAFGGAVDDALPAAVAIELMHSAFLVHDDIQDDSETRRGEASLHVRHGLADAIHAGDTLAVRAIDGLIDQPRVSVRVARRVAREFLDMADRTLTGQGMELRWRDDPDRDVSLDDYLRLVLHKTCWYTTIFPLRAGGILGSRGRLPLGSLTTFGFLLGASFQIRDDVLNLAGDPARHGKDGLADIREGKRTLALIHLRRVVSGSEAARLDGFLRLRSSERTDEDVTDVLAMMHRHQSIEHATAWGRTIADAAADALGPAFLQASKPKAVEFIAGLTAYAAERTV